MTLLEFTLETHKHTTYEKGRDKIEGESVVWEIKVDVFTILSSRLLLYNYYE